MATFSFETITAAQALAITAADTVILNQALPPTATVLYDTADPNITIVAGAHAVVFGPAIEAVSMAGGLHGADGSTLYIGDSAANSATLGATNDAMFGGAGADTLNAGEGNNLLQGNMGADVLTAGGGNDTIYGGQDNDHIDVGEGTNFAQGNKGDDNIVGGSGVDTLLGGQGDDTITSGTNTFAPDGANFLNGNLGNDMIQAGAGNDQVFGEDGNDTLDAGFGDNFVDGGNGADSIVAGLGFNTISGGNGDDAISSQSARLSQLDGGAGDDQIFGCGVLTGGDGNDTLNGSAGDAIAGSTLSGGAGDDVIGGSNEDDVLSGGDGDDTLTGLQGADVLSGGAGANLFKFGPGDSQLGSFFPNKHDNITDWTSSDKLVFASVGSPTAGPSLAGTDSNYVEITATDAFAAQAAATAQMGAGKLYVAAQVGADVVLFADLGGAHFASDAFFLVGRTLGDISFSNIISG